MQDITYQIKNKTSWTENLNISSKFVQANDDNFSINSWDLNIIRIRRFLKNNSFNIEIQNATKHTWGKKIIAFVNINNQVEYEMEAIFDPNNLIYDKRIYKFHHNYLNNFPFHNIEQITIGLKTIDSKIILYYVLNFQHLKQKKDFYLKDQELLKLSFIKEINIWNRKSIEFKDDNLNYKTISGKNELRTHFNTFDIFYLNNNYDRTLPVNKIADIYIEKYEYDWAWQDLYIDKGTVKTSSNNKGYKLEIKKPKNTNIFLKYDAKPEEEDEESILVQIYYSIFLNEHTQYNFEKEKTETKFSNNSLLGEIIPYSFKGNYKWTINIDFSPFIKNINFYFNQIFNQKLLSIHDGFYILKIDNDSKEKIKNQYKINAEKFLKIKKLSNISLIGIKRLSTEI